MRNRGIENIAPHSRENLGTAVFSEILTNTDIHPKAEQWSRSIPDQAAESQAGTRQVQKRHGSSCLNLPVLVAKRVLRLLTERFTKIGARSIEPVCIHAVNFFAVNQIRPQVFRNELKSCVFGN